MMQYFNNISSLIDINSKYSTQYVTIGGCVGGDDRIWTVSVNTESKNIPFVLIHGYAGGAALWVQNIDALAQNNPVYAIDLLGFGKSSRSEFSSDAETIEKQYCDSIERWSKAMKIDKMILVGHSFGGFLSSSFTMRYPESVQHLALIDPWGFNKKPDMSRRTWLHKAMTRFYRIFPPFLMVRAAGPMGEFILLNVKSTKDIMEKYKNFLKDPRVIGRYLHQCNTRRPSGEIAFKNISDDGPWASKPMGERMKANFPRDIPLTFLYGKETQLRTDYGDIIKESRNNCYTKVEFVERAEHFVFADNPEDFNKFVIEACAIIKNNKK
jgi:abhydrolase domain-containing protein 4